MEENKKEISPSQYFDYLKGAKKNITIEELKKSFSVFLTLAEKYKKLGQEESLKKLCFLADTLQKEEKLIEMGVTTYVYKDTIEDYIEKVASKTVKIIELSRYMREIPDDLVEVVEKTKDIFDEFYVVFTDYTGKHERQVAKERRDKDPILFGAFMKKQNSSATSVSDRFYFLGDWIDEYCDLTLDKMVAEYETKKGFSPQNEIEIPTTTEELVNILQTYRPAEKKSVITLSDGFDHPVSIPTFKKEADTGEKKSSFFEKVRSIFKK